MPMRYPVAMYEGSRVGSQGEAQVRIYKWYSLIDVVYSHKFDNWINKERRSRTLFCGPPMFRVGDIKE